MTGKGHCRFDIAPDDSEFAEFYDFSDLKEEEDGECDNSEQSDMESENDKRKIQEGAGTTSSRHNPLLVDYEDSVRLPSGRTISRKTSAQTELSYFTQLRRHRARNPISQLEYTSVEQDEKENEGTSSDMPETQISSLSKRQKREKAMLTYQMAHLSANDRNGLIHLSAPQQRSILATQRRQAEKMQREERRRQSKIERKGNKNLYAYWATETPVYLCG
jgi:pre-60S factor REI1